MQLLGAAPPDDPKELQSEISARYERLSNRLQRIARYAVDHPNDMAMETIAILAERAQVQPSALIRFAKAFGYTGFSEMQQVFRKLLKESSPSYSERVRQFWEQREDLTRPLPLNVLREFAAANQIALQHVENTLTAAQLEQAVEWLATARIIHVMGQRRSFPVAAYLAYALNHSNRPTQLLDGMGGMLLEQLRLLSPQDVLVAISFYPYAQETVDLVSRAVDQGINVIAITGSSLSPIAQKATLCLEVKDAEVFGFRSLTASMCLAQTLAVSLVVIDV
ncbi:MAG: MurR/RpiR family transcriptional regulator [Candidatus Competibacteraceae bacterium]|nr:MurR/RpiR family transcriptional regulator [Candidatus Competibacteraceae bacterium]MCB1805263.1 MurR/RpiR family transcriptional regulator [Candidatus Competibacteraceae bacterium]MCB1813578.1 MurR/RpiR family transcriptional regulator [Candidatus Competibacteraceae bacterium]